MRLVVGLGNPGPAYEANRHNVGFMVVEELEGELVAGFGGLYGEVSIEGRDVALLMPMTFMNRSGDSVVAAMDTLGLAPEEVLVVHDELDLSLGTLKLKRGGGTGGHNGLKSIVHACGDPGFDRLRVGIGRPVEGSIVDWVLSDFDESDGAALDDVLEDATRAVRAVVANGTRHAMNAVNARDRD